MLHLRSFLARRRVVVGLLTLLAIGLAALLMPLALRGPQIVRITPTDSSTDANPAAGVRIEFDQPVWPASVKGAVTFDPPGPVSVEWHGTSVIVQPKGGLRYGTHYQIKVAATARNLLGRTLQQPLTLAFTTAPFVAVTHFGPDQGASDVSLNAPITVEFAAPIVPVNALTDPARAAKLPQPLRFSTPIPGEGRWISPQLFGFYPKEGLRAATTYTVTVEPDLSRDGRLKLEQPLVWHFATESPLLAGSRPFDGATDVSPTSPVEVRLAADVDLHSASAHFSLYDTEQGTIVAGKTEPLACAGQPVTGDKSACGFRFRASAPFRRGVSYLARLEPGILTTAGTTLNTDAITWQFRVQGDLEVTQVAPTDGTTNVTTDTQRISISFNHPVMAAGAGIGAPVLGPQPAIITVTPALPGVGYWLDSSTYIYSPTVRLALATGYTARLHAGLSDQGGGKLQKDVVWSFSTTLPALVSTLITPNERNASPSDPITLTFNQPMDPVSLRSAVSLIQSNSKVVVPAAVVVAGNRATVVPSTQLERGANYTLVVAKTARIANGKATLPNRVTSTFHVAPLPSLGVVQPVNNGRWLDAGDSIHLTFNTLMDWPSVMAHLTITPQPTSVYTWTYATGDGFTLNLSANFVPETEYHLTLDGGAHDQYGVPLGANTTLSFRTNPILPSLSILGPYGIAVYSSYLPARLPLRHINTPVISYTLTRIDSALVPSLLGGSSDNRQFSWLAPLKSETVTLKGEHNHSRLDLLTLGRLDPGIYQLVVGGPNIQTSVKLMSVSPYALTIKRSAGQLFVWAADMATGEPVPDLPLSVASFSYDDHGLRAPLDLGRTGADGTLHVPFTSTDAYSPLYVWSPIAKGKPGPIAFGTTAWDEGISPYDFDLRADNAPTPTVGSIYTDRPLYRPAQTVFVRGALRQGGDPHYRVPPAGTLASLTVKDPGDSTVFTRQVALSAFGTFTTSLELAPGAVLGSYAMQVQLADDGNAHDAPISGSFSVAEYRKPVFEVTAAPAKPEVVADTPLEMNVTAHYYFGGPVANAPVRWRLMATPLHFSSAAAEHYSFTNEDDQYRWYRSFEEEQTEAGRQVADGQATTDATGQLTLRLPADLGTDKQSKTFTLDVEVTDVDGQVVASQATANVHAGAFYIGLRPTGYLAQVGQPQQVSVMTLDTAGKPEGNHALEVGIYRREWYSTRENGNDGQLHWTSRFSDTLVQTIPATTDPQGRANVTFTPASNGTYRIGATGRDGVGHTIMSSAFTWVYGGGEAFWGVDDSNRVSLVADKDKYRPGDTAHILVPAPYNGMRALVTTERGEVLSHRLLTLTSTTELIDVPITGDDAPNVYLSVVLLRPSASLQAGVPDLRVGMLNLPVATEQQQLHVTVTPDVEQAAPRDKVTYTVTTTDYAGRGVSAEVSLALVDKAILALKDDPNPSLLRAFYEQRMLGVFTSQTLTMLEDRVTAKLLPGEKGGGGGGLSADILVRRNFPDTAYWNPSVVTGDDGVASVSLTLPDNLTTWRMTARAITADTRVGEATDDLVATEPLLVRPAWPRFLTVGDQPVLRAVVHNHTQRPLTVTVTLDPGILTLSGPAAQAVAVGASDETVVSWPVSVGTNLRTSQEARLRLTVTAHGSSTPLGDIIEQTLPIQHFATPPEIISAGQVTDTVVLPTPSGTSPDDEMRLELMPSITAGLGSGLEYLQSYPYGCTEQTTSSFLPNAVIRWLLKLFGVEGADANLPLNQGLTRNLDAGMQRLMQLQHPDGGWGWWEDDPSQPYLTAYALEGLLAARKAGYSVDATMINRGIDYLQNNFNQSTATRAEWWSGDARAYVLYVLAEAGKPDRGRSVALYDQRTSLGIYGRAYLLMTFHALGGEDERVHTLVGELLSSAIVTDFDAHWEERETGGWMMNSNTRSTALALQALVRVEPDNPLVQRAVHYLMRLRADGHWDTTQESAATLMALAEYLSHSGERKANYTYSVLRDGQSLTSGAVTAANLDQSVTLALPQGDGGRKTEDGRAATGSTVASAGDSDTLPSGSGLPSLVIQKHGPGTLFYTLTTRHYQPASSVQPADQGLSLERSYNAIDPRTLLPTGRPLSEVTVGDVVQVRLTLTVAATAHYLAVEDMLPGGLEAIDTSLKTAPAAAQNAQLQSDRDDTAYWRFWTQTTVHDNRVVLFTDYLTPGTYHYTYLARATTPGTFETMPATAYEMYTPQIHGNSSGTMFTVR